MPEQPQLTDVIAEMRRYGYSDDQIIAYLQQQGISPKDIFDAINKLKVPAEKEKEEMPSIMEAPAPTPTPTPTPTPMPMPTAPPAPTAPAPTATPAIIPTVPFSQEAPSVQVPTGYDVEALEAMIEGIIGEKWEILKRRIADIEELRKQIEAKILSIEERLKRVELNLDKIYLAILKRQDEQVKEIKAVGKEIDMLEEAFSKILKPLSENIKRLEEISKEIKKRG
jgi:DNA-binding transcriptional MerR regulator